MESNMPGFRCSSCNKFVATEVEIESAEASDVDIEGGIINLSISLNKNCSDCGETVATATIEFEVTISEADAKKLEPDELGKDAEWESSN
jgi:hypothetical protein